MGWRQRVHRVGRGMATPILRNNGFIFGATLVVGLANYLLHITGIRGFAPGEYSQFGIMLNLLATTGTVSSAMIGALIRQGSLNRAAGVAEQTDALQRALVRYLSIALLIALVVVAVAHAPIAQFLHLTTTLPLPFVCVAGYWVIVQGVLQATLQEEGKYGKLSLVFLGEGVFRGVVGVTVIAAGLGISFTLAVYAVSAWLAALAMPRPRRLWTGKRAAGPLLHPVYRDIGQLLLANLCSILLTSFDVILCRRYLDPLLADRYVALAALAKFFLFATQSVSAVAFAEVVRATSRGERSTRSLVLSLGLIAALGVPFTAFCAVFGPLIMALTGGGAFRDSGHALWITALSAFAMSVINLEVAYFNARKWLWYLPVLLLGSAATVAALPLANGRLAGYAGVCATGTTTLALLLLIPLFGVLVRRDGARPALTMERAPREEIAGAPHAGPEPALSE